MSPALQLLFLLLFPCPSLLTCSSILSSPLLPFVCPLLTRIARGMRHFHLPNYTIPFQSPHYSPALHRLLGCCPEVAGWWSWGKGRGQESNEDFNACLSGLNALFKISDTICLSYGSGCLWETAKKHKNE